MLLLSGEYAVLQSLQHIPILQSHLSLHSVTATLFDDNFCTNAATILPIHRHPIRPYTTNGTQWLHIDAVCCCHGTHSQASASQVQQQTLSPFFVCRPVDDTHAVIVCTNPADARGLLQSCAQPASKWQLQPFSQVHSPLNSGSVALPKCRSSFQLRTPSSWL